MSWEFVAVVLGVLAFMLLSYVHVLKTRLSDAVEVMGKLEAAHRELLEKLKESEKTEEPEPTLWDIEEFKRSWLFDRWEPAPTLEDERQGRPIRVYLWGKTSVFTRYQTLQMQNELDRVSPGTKLLLEEVKQ